MKKGIVATALAFYMLSSVSTAFAFTGENAAALENEVVVEESIEDAAGVLPDSGFYGLERALESLQIAITSSEGRLAELQAKFSVERAAESAVMTEMDNQELADKAAAEYAKTLASAEEHLNKAIEAADKAEIALAAVNQAYKDSEIVLMAVLERAPESAKAGLEGALAVQDKTIAAVSGFYAAKAAFFAAKMDLEEAKRELKAARKSGDSAAILAAEEKVRAAELAKDELEVLKDLADAAKEEVKGLAEEAEKSIESGYKQVEKAEEKMDKVEEKAGEEAKKAEEKEREAVKKAEEKAREAAKKAQEKAREKSEDDDDDEDEDDDDDDEDDKDDDDKEDDDKDDDEE